MMEKEVIGMTQDVDIDTINTIGMTDVIDVIDMIDTGMILYKYVYFTMHHPEK